MRRRADRSRLGVALIVSFAAFAVACSGVSRLDLTTLSRATWQRPEDVVAALAIAPGATVADLGAGEGYFVPYLAEAVGASGRVLAVEVDDALVAELEERFAADANVAVIRGELEDPKLPDGAVDLVLIVNTYHHIEDRVAYFERLAADLAPNGRVAVIEPDEDLSGVLRLFLDEGHTSRASEIARELGEAGYRHAASHDLLPVQVFEEFTR